MQPVKSFLETSGDQPATWRPADASALKINTDTGQFSQAESGSDVPLPTGVGILFSSKTIIMPGQIDNLRASPVNLLGPPGTGKCYLPFGFFLRLHFGTTPYTGGIYSLEYYLDPNTTESLEDRGILGATVDSCVWPGTYYTGLLPRDAVSNYENRMLTIWAAEAITGGDGVLDITVYYSILDFNV